MTTWPSTFNGWLVFFITSLILVVVGNTLWEYALRPMISKIGSSIFQFVVHSGSKFSNSLIKAAAQRHDSVDRLHIILTVGFASLVLGLGAFALAQKLLEPSEFKSIEAQLKRIESLPLEQRIKEYPQLRPKLMLDLQSLKDKQEKYKYVLGILSIFVSAFLFIASIRALFIRNLITSFDWCLALYRPLMSEDEYIKLRSQWAMMQSSRHLDVINSHIKQIQLRQQPSVCTAGVFHITPDHTEMESKK